MPGDFFSTRVRELERQLVPRERLADLGTLEDLVLERRRDARSSTGEFAERAALAALCCITWPGKLPPYKRTVQRMRGQLVGVSRDRLLQQAFHRAIRPPLIHAEDEDELTLERFEDVFLWSFERPDPGGMRGEPDGTPPVPGRAIGEHELLKYTEGE